MRRSDSIGSNSSYTFSEADEAENGFSNLVGKLKKEKKAFADSAVEISKKWAQLNNVTDLPENVCSPDHWQNIESGILDEAFEHSPRPGSLLALSEWPPQYFEHFPITPTEECKFEISITNVLLHYWYNWSDIFPRFLISAAEKSSKLSALKRQMHNILHIIGLRKFGARWLKHSLKQERGLVEVMEGYDLDVLLKDIPRNTTDAPIDDIDTYIYNGVVEHAKQNRPNVNEHRLTNWTMVRARIRRSGRADNGSHEIRVYGFSGDKTTAERNTVPSEWWSDCYTQLGQYEGVDLHLGVIDEQKFAQNMILCVFKLLNKNVVEDLLNINEKVVSKKNIELFEILESTRHDCRTIHYESYNEKVVEKIVSYDKTIEQIMFVELVKKLKEPNDTLEARAKREAGYIFERCIADNPYNVNLPNLKEAVKAIIKKDDRDEVVHNINVKTQAILNKMKKDLHEYPTTYLSKLLKDTLRKSHCAEDNALGMVLQTMIETSTLTLYAKVDFLPMSKKGDLDPIAKKPFCPSCLHKSHFYSIIPFFLKHLGVNFQGQEHGQYANILKKLFIEIADMSQDECDNL